MIIMKALLALNTCIVWVFATIVLAISNVISYDHPQSHGKFI